MMQILCVLLPPTIALLLSLRDRKNHPRFLAAYWLLDALFLYIGNGALMTVLGRAAVRIGWLECGWRFLYIEHGATAMLSAMAFGVLLGVVRVPVRRWLSIREVVIPAKKERQGALRAALRVLVHLLMLLMLALTFAYIWGVGTFGSVEFEQIWFHINMPMEGASDSLVGEFLRIYMGSAAAAFVLFELLTNFPAKTRRQIRGLKCDRLLLQIFPLRLPFASAAFLCLALWFVFLFSSADYYFGFTQYIRNQMDQSELFVNDYVDPQNVKITFPENKRNLITIYLESCETSAQDTENGGYFEGVNYIPELTALAKEYVSFSHSDKLEGAVTAPACGWTIAAMVAQTAGLPLKMYTFADKEGEADNQMEEFAYFMPGATAIGDILKDAGYRNVFMAGSDFTFGGRRQYYTQHGDYEILDYLVARERGVISPEHYASWGFEDSILYSWAKETVTELAAGDQPFNFSMLTVDQHTPFGYLCELCPDTYDEQYANVMACSSRQLSDFVAWCREQPFWENTTIVVTGDHASMVVGFYGSGYEKHLGDTERKVYNAFINSAVEPVQEKNRLFTTMDIFPSTLAALGVSIEGDRLGLGTNLFSKEKTLAEQYGYDHLFDEMLKKSTFYNEEILFP